MSVSRNKKRKAKRQAADLDTKRIRRLIKSGELSAFHFVRSEKGFLENGKKIRLLDDGKPQEDGKVRYYRKGLTLRQASTLAVLTKKK